MSETPKVKGPASYFPSVEKDCGQPIDRRLKVLDGVKDRTHMEMVGFLKNEHRIGHGHVNALVAYYREQKQPG